MIGSLRGRLAYKQAPSLQLDVGGIGYEIEAPMTTFYKLPSIGEEIQLYTHLVIRDDAHLLFGFATEQERLLFRTLIKVNGVGAKMALAILSGIEADEFVRCVTDGDTVSLAHLPGIGKKTADRLIVEMRDQLRDWQSDRFESIDGTKYTTSAKDATEEAISALISLGYKPQEAGRFVQNVAKESMDCEDIIREALKASVR